MSISKKQSQKPVKDNKAKGSANPPAGKPQQADAKSKSFFPQKKK